LGVPITAAAEDQANESPEIEGPLHSIKELHYWALCCKGNSSIILATQAVDRFY
jgi:hypothetical protein